MQEIRDRVSAIQSQLPEGVEAPVVQKFDVGAAPIMSIALAGELDPRALTRLADKVVQGARAARGGRGRRRADGRA